MNLETLQTIALVYLLVATLISLAYIVGKEYISGDASDDEYKFGVGVGLGWPLVLFVVVYAIWVGIIAAVLCLPHWICRGRKHEGGAA